MPPEPTAASAERRTSAGRTHPDACPGAVDVHQAADGGLARVRVPGGTLSAARVDVLRAAAIELGDGCLELTSRANVQIRGLAPGAEHELGARLAEAGLLPSTTHERVRNIVAAPLEDNQALVDAIDAALCADPALASLPGRFLVTVGGAVSGLAGDVGLVGDALFLAGRDSGLRVTDPVAAVVTAARLFQQLRGDAWRLSEVDGGVRKITAALGEPGDARVEPTVTPVAPGEHDRVVVAGVPLGRWDARLLAGVPVRLTPWRSLVLPSGSDTSGLFTSSGSPWHGVSACAGRPGCAKSLADVRSDASRWVGTRTAPGQVHWSGCARRCGRPAGDVVEFVATGDGYEEIR
jgi:precorrin-3B synthase